MFSPRPTDRGPLKMFLDGSEASDQTTGLKLSGNGCITGDLHYYLCDAVLEKSALGTSVPTWKSQDSRCGCGCDAELGAGPGAGPPAPHTARSSPIFSPTTPWSAQHDWHQGIAPPNPSIHAGSRQNARKVTVGTSRHHIDDSRTNRPDYHIRGIYIPSSVTLFSFEPVIGRIRPVDTRFPPGSNCCGWSVRPPLHLSSITSPSSPPSPSADPITPWGSPAATRQSIHIRHAKSKPQRPRCY